MKDLFSLVLLILICWVVFIWDEKLNAILNVLASSVLIAKLLIAKKEIPT